MIIYKTSDRIPFQVGKIRLLFSPLSFAQKTEINSYMRMEAGQEKSDPAKMAFLTVKYGVKAIEGCKLADGSDYKPKFQDDGILTDESTDDIMSLENAPLVVKACASLANQIKDHKIPGVVIEMDKVSSVQKKT